MPAFLKRTLWRSLGIALVASVAAYSLVLGLATVHEELDLSPEQAWPAAAWTFVIVFPISLAVMAWQRAGERKG